jgi:PhzF family phenazine biosynthesis protein
MSRYPLHQIDAFVLPDRPFSGNPAAVVFVGARWPADTLMQGVAAENNLAETAFLRRPDDGAADTVPTEQAGAGRDGAQERIDYEIRWFTPTTEVDLCGHATLASAYAAASESGPEATVDVGETVVFFSPQSGRLPVTLSGEELSLDFPADPVAALPPGELPQLAEALGEALGTAPRELYAGRSDLLAVFDGVEEIGAMAPDMRKLAALPARGVIVTAARETAAVRETKAAQAAPAAHGEVDFVSRFFAPQVGIDEDPVTGSAHTTLAPFWGPRLGTTRMTARQLSARGGTLYCELRGDRVMVGGRARRYLRGEIEV